MPAYRIILTYPVTVCLTVDAPAPSVALEQARARALGRLQRLAADSHDLSVGTGARLDTIVLEDLHDLEPDPPVT